MISFISSLEIINVVKPDPNMFLSIGPSVAAAAVNPLWFKYIFYLRQPVFSNGPKSLP